MRLRAMQKNSRFLILVLALVALGASVASLYVHYKLLTDLTYSSFCDVSETVSCQAVYQSPYGTAFGVPVAAGGVIWSALVVLLGWFGMRAPRSEVSERTAGYIFLWSVVGLATVFYFAYTSFFVLGKLCLLCTTVYVAVTGIFLASSGAAPAMLKTLPARVGPDLRAMFASPMAVGLAALWLLGSTSLLAFFPREGGSEQSASGTSQAAPAPPLETLTDAQISEWQAWIDAQPREAGAAPPAGVKVLVIKFNDYQCPSCKAAHALYKDIFAKYEASHPGVFKFQTRDYPLESECGYGGVHGSACEAAVAVRLARTKNKDKELENWLFARQAEMTKDVVKQGLAEVASLNNFDAEYARVLEDVRADARLGQELKVSGTPTFFLNGIRLPSLRPAYLDAAIAYMLSKPS
jgi:uncharacterized membrane protein